MKLSPIKRPKVHEAIVRQLEEAIASGELKVGDRLPSERELMSAFNVGRPAVREAILTLERNGLLQISNGERAIISYPSTAKVLSGLSSAVRVAISTREGVESFQYARKILEVALARRAAQMITEEQIAALENALAANRAALDDPERFAITDVEFHSAIAQVSGSTVISGLHEVMSDWLIQQRVVTLSQKGTHAEAYDYHRKIYEALRLKDADAAERLMSEHMDAVFAAYWGGKPQSKA